MAITKQTKIYRLTGITSLLGSQPSSETVRTNYILAKHPEVDASGEIVPSGEESGGPTVFYRNENDDLVLMDYQVKGFFKSAMATLKADLNIGMAAKKNDQFLFVAPRCIPVLKDGRPIQEEDGILERPLRALTMQGERVSLASSELIDAPWTVEFSVTIIQNSGTAKSSALTFDSVEAALDYGRFSGLGQWRNGGHGRFEWEEVE